MDFFQSEINSFEDDSLSHWNADDVQIWSSERFVSFLENQCGLTRSNPTKGRIFNFHEDTYFTLQELIDRGSIHPPFPITYIDAHSDMAYDTSISYYRFLKTLSNVNKGEFKRRRLASGFVRFLILLFRKARKSSRSARRGSTVLHLCTQVRSGALLVTKLLKPISMLNFHSLNFTVKISN